jgi:hypothetical protein
VRGFMLRSVLVPVLAARTSVAVISVPVPTAMRRGMALPVTPKSWVHFSMVPSARAVAPGGIDGAGDMPRTKQS